MPVARNDMTLPVDAVLPQLQALFAQRPVVVLEAPPGAGKTTRVPPALLDADWLGGQSILMLEPRRLAARSAAEFMARQRGERAGATVGYRVRYEQCVSKHTRIEVITEGILARRLHTDPELTGVGLVIFDEFHERSIHSDLALALTNDLRKGLREDLRLLVMSATLDSEPLCRLLDAERLSSAGRSWPVETVYLGGGIALDCVQPMVTTLRQVAAQTSGDILAFFPGVREIELARERLAQQLPALAVLPLHGSLDPAAQRAVLRRGEQRRLILATNIAETSLTLDGITTVVDSGLCRQPGFDPASGLGRLQTVRISQASSTQRAGRAGRQGPGRCYRLWSEGRQAALLPQTPPEIRSADLTPLALALCAWGLPDASQLDWLDPPPAGALAAANRLLQQLDLVDAHGRPSTDGERALSLPLHPRLAALVLEAERRGLLAAGCLLAAFLDQPPKTRSDHADLQDEVQRLAAELTTNQAQRQPVGRVFSQLASRFNCSVPAVRELDVAALAPLLAHAYPDRIAAARSTGGDYLISSGRAARLPPHHPLQKHAWLVASDIAIDRQGIALIRRALPLDAKWLAQCSAATDWQEETCWDEMKQRVQARRVKRLGALELCSEQQKTDPDRALDVVCAQLRDSGEQLLDWSPKILQLLRRINLLHGVFGEPWPHLESTELLKHPEDWLVQYLSGVSSAAQLKKLDLRPAILSLLDWQQSRQLDQLAPLRFEVPSGEMMKVDYRPEGPLLPAKLQQLFGLGETPCICQGRIELRLELLSPAGRPLAVTSDLRSFWDQVYPEVRKEMRGRYPKHPWPEDPWNAVPTRRTNRALR